MDTTKSGKFFVGSIITFFVVFILVQVILMSMVAIGKNIVAPESMAEEDVIERIQPVAQVNVGEEPVAVAAAPVEEETTAGPGATVVTQVCALCHRSGMMSSPKLGNAADWAPRIEKGIDTLYSNAINGINMMPARGGRPDLSDDDVKAAVDYMLLDLQ